MRLTSVDLHNSAGDKIVELSFRDPTSQNPYTARSITGLDADEIIARFYGVSNVSNSKYYDLAMNKREVIIRIALNPEFSTQTYSGLRDEIYKMISATRTGQIDIRLNDTGETVAHVTGFITKMEAAHFNELPEVQLTVQCDDPMLRGMDEIVTSPSSGFSVATIIDDESTAPHGFKFVIVFTGNESNFELRDSATPEWSFKVVYPFVSGDVLGFSSAYGNRYLYVVRGSTTTHLVDKVTPESIWPILFPGVNLFDTPNANISWYEVSFFPAYWGV